MLYTIQLPPEVCLYGSVYIYLSLLLPLSSARLSCCSAI